MSFRLFAFLVVLASPLRAEPKVIIDNETRSWHVQVSRDAATEALSLKASSRVKAGEVVELPGGVFRDEAEGVMESYSFKQEELTYKVILGEGVVTFEISRGDKVLSSEEAIGGEDENGNVPGEKAPDTSSRKLMKVQTKGSPLMLRTAPDADDDASIIARIPNGTQVQTTGESSADWTKVEHDGKQGWVASRYLAEVTP